ncbi:hypothetical protein K9N68_16715 [Kovacikia minuta CCNUW1]|uniref:hypothetical protein n=1 Tax=Kovacikia minuta TaxID=2931930 RepID=UPI001CCAE1A2|nr:hypothetical protein [Kovacikia minuta]UBF29328.1 hypothetical protein K9N68_16715 [Kovacikia minuta CCNUW1]
MPNDSSDPIEHIILEALQQGDKNRGQLFDLTGKSYPILVQTLQRLKNKNLIETYFVPTGSISILTYRLHTE